MSRVDAELDEDEPGDRGERVERPSAKTRNLFADAQAFALIWAP